MEIVTRPAVSHVELIISGRIDAMWGEHLNAAIEDTVRGGGHRIVLNFAGVDYISSMGLRVLLVQYKLLKSVNGSLSITNPSEFCRNIFSVVGLSSLIAEENAGIQTDAGSASRKQSRGTVDYEIYPQATSRGLSWRLVGDAARLASTGFDEADCRTLSFPVDSFGLGIGAFGQGYSDCADRFGEFLAAGGCAISLPTNDPQAMPDYVMAEGQLIPQMQTLYAIAGEGDFSTMARFDCTAEGPGKVTFSTLIEDLLEISGETSLGVAILAETSGIVGATLRRSPAGKPVAHQLPEVRDWLSFTTERSTDKSLCLIVGVVCREADARTKAYLRAMKDGSELWAHFHAAVFPYRPVQRGELPFAETVAAMLAASSPGALLHLMADSRRFEGVGETDLVRGACWFGALPAAGGQA